MSLTAIIGGSGLRDLSGLQITHREVVRTPFGEPSAPLVFGKLQGNDVLFLPRHGPGHTIPPHEINYRANIWSLDHVGVTHVIAVAAVGSITGLAPTGLMIPDQIIDYTHGRLHTFFSGEDRKVTHVDFTEPYCNDLREKLIQSATKKGIKVECRGTYAATQGPRFESAAEIRKLERDGADIVGMTGMPETVLAKELGLCYATIAISANHAAGKSEVSISLDQIERNLQKGMIEVKDLVEATVPELRS